MHEPGDPLTQLLYQSLPLLIEHIGDDDLGALRHEQPRLLLPLPPRTTGDEDDPSVELAHSDS